MFPFPFSLHSSNEHNLWWYYGVVTFWLKVSFMFLVWSNENVIPFVEDKKTELWKIE